MTTDLATEWTHIDKGSPPCDGDTVYVGINSNGYCGCFNEICITTKYGVTCVYETAEEPVETMSGLTYWKKLDMPKEQP